MPGLVVCCGFQRSKLLMSALSHAPCPAESVASAFVYWSWCIPHIPEESCQCSCVTYHCRPPFCSISQSLSSFSKILYGRHWFLWTFRYYITISHLELIRRFALQSRRYCHQICACCQMELGLWHYSASLLPFTQHPHLTPY